MLSGLLVFQVAYCKCFHFPIFLDFLKNLISLLVQMLCVSQFFVFVRTGTLSLW